MNYHLMIDEKFIDDFIADAERAAPGNNTYLVSLYTPEPRYTRSPLITYVKSVERYWFDHIAASLSDNDRVFIHWLDRRVYRILLALPPHITTGIFCWMGDLVTTPLYLFDKDILEPQSYAFFRKYKKGKFQPFAHHGKLKNALLRLRHIYRRLHAPAEWRTKKKVMQRLDLFFHWSEIDYRWVEERYPGFGAAFVYFFYGVGTQSIASGTVRTAPGGEKPVTIWLGNSATIENNHFEALDALSGLQNENIEIICPLSYGEPVDSKYTTDVIRKGHALFGNRFRPLLEFLDRDNYYALFERVDFVVMNHIRSQAAGNIFAFLAAGKPLFMNEKSSLYRLLIEKRIPNVDTIRHLQSLSFKEMIQEMTAKPDNHEALQNLLDERQKEANLKKHLG